MNDSYHGVSERKIMCLKCGRYLTSSEIIRGFCPRCRIAEREVKREDEILAKIIADVNKSLGLQVCPFCGELTLSHSARYSRKEWFDLNTPIIERNFCSNGRCKAVGNSLESMKQNINLFIKLFNVVCKLIKID